MTDNICVSYSLIHGSIGTVKHSDRRSKPLFSTIYIKFDDPKAANSLKDRRGCGKLKEYVPISARTKRFPLKKEKSTVIAEKKTKKTKQTVSITWPCKYYQVSGKYSGL